jgi:DNA helicase-2/ATP-dependent DNA helicase PcrA
MHEEDSSPDGNEANIRGRAALRHELHRLRDEVESRLQMNALSLYRRFLGEDAPSPAFAALCHEVLAGGVSALAETDASLVMPETARAVPDASLAEAVRIFTLDSLSAGIMPHEDLAAVFHLALCTSLCNPDLKAKHVLVDEAQDYSRIQYGVFRRLYPHAGITLLGDSNQNIRTDFAIGHLDTAASILAPEDNMVLALKRTYRSTLQISRFSDAFMLEPVHTEHFGRTGEKPALLHGNNWDSLPAILTPLLTQDLADGRKTVTLITRTMADAQFLYSLFAVPSGVMTFAGYKVHLVDESYRRALEGLLVIPSYLAKGLEFDHVVVILSKRNEYVAPEEKGLFHTVCSRALHLLTLVSLDGMPDILSGVPAALYENHK